MEPKGLAFIGTYKNVIINLGQQIQSPSKVSVCFPGAFFRPVHHGRLQERPSVHPGQQSHPPAAGGQRLPRTSRSGGKAPEPAREVHLRANHSRSGVGKRDLRQTSERARIAAAAAATIAPII